MRTGTTGREPNWVLRGRSPRQPDGSPGGLRAAGGVAANGPPLGRCGAQRGATISGGHRCRGPTGQARVRPRGASAVTATDGTTRRGAAPGATRRPETRPPWVRIHRGHTTARRARTRRHRRRPASSAAQRHGDDHLRRAAGACGRPLAPRARRGRDGDGHYATTIWNRVRHRELRRDGSGPTARRPCRDGRAGHDDGRRRRLPTRRRRHRARPTVRPGKQRARAPGRPRRHRDVEAARRRCPQPARRRRPTRAWLRPAPRRPRGRPLGNADRRR